MEKITVEASSSSLQQQPNTDAFCMGCGADIAVANDGKENAFTLSTTSQPRRQEHQDFWRKTKLENWSVCPRCIELNRRTKEAEEAANDHDLLFDDNATTPFDNMDTTLLDLSPQRQPSMLQAFRDNVSLIRRIENAIVIVCVDATNTNGTLLTRIRNYVGGNTILLAVTRCDLLPTYVWENPDTLLSVFRQRAEHMQPAAIYLCSSHKNAMRELGGVQQLVHDVWERTRKRSDQDVYIVGCANIGKSTLTDLLVQSFLTRGRQDFRSFRDRERWKALTEHRAQLTTQSSLSGTTLANIRIPCFANFQQAVWDTPGLVVDNNTRLFPFSKAMLHAQAQRPSQPITPCVHVEHVHKSLAFCVYDQSADEIPLIRFEVRLKKNKNETADDNDDDAPMRLVWNSIYTAPNLLQTKVMPIDQALEQEQALQASVAERNLKEEEDQQAFVEQRQIIMQDLGLSHDNEEEVDSNNTGDKQEPQLSDEEKVQARQRAKARRKEIKNQLFAEYERRQIAKLGQAEYDRQKVKRAQDFNKLRRDTRLCKLEQLHQVVLEPQEGMDIMLAHLGWLSVLMPRTAMVRVYTPQVGTVVGHFASLALPPSWGEYRNSVQVGSNEGQEDTTNVEDSDMDEWEGPEDVTDDLDTGAPSSPFLDKDSDQFAFQHGVTSINTDEFGLDHPVQFAKRFVVQNEALHGGGENPWDFYCGEKVGWIWDNDPRRLRGKLDIGWNPIPDSWNGKDMRSEFVQQRRSDRSGGDRPDSRSSSRRSTKHRDYENTGPASSRRHERGRQGSGKLWAGGKQDR